MKRPAANARNRELTRQRILQCALELFAEKGYDGATTREIASRAGVNHSMIAFYYGGKEKLWNSAVDWLFEESIRAVDLEAVDRAANDVERFELLVRHFVRYSARHPEHARLVIQESLRPGKRLRPALVLAAAEACGGTREAALPAAARSRCCTRTRSSTTICPRWTTTTSGAGSRPAR